jgi:hypothetical protein
MRAQKSRVRSNFGAAIVCGLLLSSLGCGLLNQIAKIPQPTPMSVAGNWQFDLLDSNGNVGAIATGFLQQSGANVTGALDVGNCGSNASVTGTVGGTSGTNAINLAVNVNGQTLTIVGSGIGTITPGTAIQGNYTVGAMGCAISGLTATASAQQINTISGAFHGSLHSSNGSTLNISGNVSQGQSTGLVTSDLTGTATVTGSTCFAAVNLSGTISGTSVELNLASSDGSSTAQLSTNPQPAAGQLSTAPGSFTITQLAGNYAVKAGSCSGDSGTLSLSFP